MKIHINKVCWRTLLSLFFIATLLLGTVCVYANEEVIWGDERNSETNNPVTDRPAFDYDNAFLKWGKSFGDNAGGTSFAEKPSPPLIIGDSLYTQIDRYIYQIDKKSGETIKISEQLPDSSDWASHSMTYGEGKLFVALRTGMVCAVDISTLEISWKSNEIKGQQMNCPITYRRINETGYVFTGSWSGEKKDGHYYCYSASDGILKWEFTPSTDDPSLENSEYRHRGFYWAGAYVTDTYIAIGSDDGAGEGFFDASGEASAVLYILDPISGEIKDQVNGFYGDLRSTPVYYNEKLYFTSKGGIIYQIPITNDGKLGTPCSYDANTNLQPNEPTRMITAAPAIFNNRLYVGISHGGDQFGPSGSFAVLDVSKQLSQDSLIYETKTSGYPQASPLISTSEYNSTGNVYVYFTYNSIPGGISYIVDSNDIKSQNEAPEHCNELFFPEDNYIQNCISTLAMDLDGTIYYVNDSCALMAVSRNEARISQIEVVPDIGDAFCEEDFRSGTANYKYVISTDSKKALIKLDLADGVTATINGKAYISSGITVDLPEEQTEIKVESFKGSFKRCYNLSLIKESSDSFLSDWIIANQKNNSLPDELGLVQSSLKEDASGTRFITTSFIETIAHTYNPGQSKQYQFISLWLKPSNPKASITVWPESNTAYSNNGSTGKPINFASTSNGFYRYPVYIKDPTDNASVTVTVTSENGRNSTIYKVIFLLCRHVETVTLDKHELTLNPNDMMELQATIIPEEARNKSLAFYSSDPTVAKVNYQTGKVTAVSAGECAINVITEDGEYVDTCKVIVNGDKETDPAKLASFIDDAISELPAISNIKPLYGPLITSVTNAFGSLPEDAQKIVTEAGLKQLEACKSALALSKYKDAQLMALRNSVDYSLYNENEQKRLTQILSDAENTIKSATTTDQIDSAYQDALSKIAKVPTSDAVNNSLAAEKVAFQKTKIAGFTATMKNLKQVQTSWKAVKNATYYQLSWKLNEAGSWKTIEIESEEGTKRLITGLSEGTCVKVRVRAARIIASEDVFSEWSTPVKVLMHKGTLKKLTKKSRGFNVVWKPLKNATGYQIQYSLKKTFKTKKTKTKNGAKSKKFRVRKLKKKKVYYVRTRAYRKVKGQVYYGSWSAVKKVKTKK